MKADVPRISVTINGPRGDEWEKACGTRTFPIVGWHPVRASLPDKPDALVYLVDVRALNGRMIDAIVTHIAEKFSLATQDVANDIMAGALPILAEDCSVSVTTAAQTKTLRGSVDWRFLS